MTTTASDKAQLISQGQILPPGCCALCGSGNSEQGYLDIRLFLEFHGQVYFCYNCVEEFIRAFDGLTYDQAQTLKVQHLNDLSTISALRAEVEEHKNDLQYLRRALAIVGDSSDSGSNDSDGSGESPLQPEDVTDERDGTAKGNLVFPESDSEVGESESEPIEPTESSRSDKSSNITASDLGI